jgi:MoxR-like ATPase
MDNTLDATENTPTPNPPTPLASVSVPETSTPDLASTSSGPVPEEAASPDPTAAPDTTAFAARTDLSTLSRHAEAIRQEMSKVIVGQQALAELLLTAILADGHVLLEGVPGVAKTLTAKLLARTLDVPFSRLQFTPDLMPSDVLGTSIFRPNKADFEFRPGPIFASIVLIDEINRAPAKTQSALFEVMEERQVTQDGTRYTVPDPFVVLATQNPIEQEGTYRLPEAQLDRFLFKLNVGYPTVEEEVSILQGHHAGFGGMPLESVRVHCPASGTNPRPQGVVLGSFAPRFPGAAQRCQSPGCLTWPRLRDA